MEQADYDGMTPQEQIDIFDRVSRKTAVDMIAQIKTLKEEVANLRAEKVEMEAALTRLSTSVSNSKVDKSSTVLAHLALNGLWRAPKLDSEEEN
jgi:hypothetical protein